MSGSAASAGTPMSVDALAELIKAHIANAPQAQGFGDNAKQVFCKDWPTVKPVLTALSGLLAAIPGVGMFAGPAIALVATAGDAASKAVCGPN